MEDHYQILGVDKTASADDIKRAYRKLAHQYHPDKDGGDEEKFKQVNNAYQTLGDAQKRAQYDQFGQTFEGGSGGSGGFNPFSEGVHVNMNDFGNFSGIGDIFNQVFNQREQTRAPNRGHDVQVDTTISFTESAQGLKKELSHRLYQKCQTCQGNGAEPGTPIKECATCRGQGTINKSRQTMLGTFTQSTTCPACRGEGKQASTPCRACRGEGRQMTDRSLTVDIPAGIADGQTIRVSGQGEAPLHSGPPGHLYVTIHVQPHSAMSRQNDNVISKLTIPFYEAALGATQTIDTLNGPKEISIPAGTQPNHTITLADQGFPHLNDSGTGDHLVNIEVTIPKRLSRKQKKLLEEFQNTRHKIFS